jgi:anti-sigma B factor antagonist
MNPRPFHPSDYVRVTVKSLPAVTVVEVSGEIDTATRHAMAEPVFEQLDEAPPGLVLDLTKIKFMGSAGLAVLIETHQRTQERRIKLGIVVPDQSPTYRVLTISGLVELLPVHSTMVDALRSLPPGERRDG